MKLKVWEADRQTEKTAYFYLIEEYGEVRVLLVDEDGGRVRNLVAITKSGLLRFNGIDEEYGFPVDAQGRIVDDT